MACDVIRQDLFMFPLITNELSHPGLASDKNLSPNGGRHGFGVFLAVISRLVA